MKCIRCQNDSKYKERGNKKCPKCHGEFAFEPNTGDKLSDAAFLAAIEAVSSKNSLRWGVENLYYEVCRRIERKGRMPAGCAIALGVAAALCCLGAVLGGEPGFYFPGVVLALFTAAAWYSRYGTRTVPLDNEAFSAMWTRWNQVHSTPPGVIVRNPRPASPRKLEADLGDYSFDRAVICDRARTVDVLLANNFHFENNCAVLSVEGYPPGPFETIRAMLKRNPRLQVFALHDATPAGCALAHKLAVDPKWFAGGVKVVDVGLRPVHAKPFNGLLLKHSGFKHVTSNAAISEAEAKWLSNYSLELAVVRPEQLLKRLFRAINKKFDPNESTGSVLHDSGGGGGGYDYDTDSFSSDAGSSDGGADSFG